MVKLDLCLHAPCFPAFFDLLISLGEKGLMILHLKRGPNLGMRCMTPYSPIKSSEFSFQTIRRRYSDIRCFCTQKKPLIRSGVLAVSMDLLCFYRGRLLLAMYAFYDK